ncbi:aminodeoxychorismate synthase component I [Dechloromonas sp. TW-R-39-2]|uniref:aminodeoxychorismate synthase component I n=1 Tax=Dechloromonas sp. TW-R-39-2 TaxID=2654218 RepID=UPI001AF863BC|nr:aminodeoxychorismate synthase component I [Dechloromonas sp. TW-R-39-2]QRM19111.1 aminodeoxychorismate synthase component I [Dechloromonas sp. TW-R-39-2]
MALDYELGYVFEPKAAPAAWQAAVERPLARFWHFARCTPLTASEADAWLAGQVALAAGGVGEIRPCISQNEHAAAVDRIKRLISDGDCYQVNLTFPTDFSWFGSALALYARLRAVQPVRYGGFVGHDREAIVSLSPELFLERQGERLVTRPMKGTAARSKAPEVLRTSAKDRAENLMIVDLLRNDLGRIAEPGSVTVDRLFDIEDYPTVWQMVSEISARIGLSSLADVLAALFPCGSITGAPKIRAMQIIAELEFAPRGLYTGALGWLAPNGDFRLNVAIRTLELAADGRGKLGVGGGIVADSVAEAEWQECLLKSQFLHRCDPGLKLIETLRLEDGVYLRRALHLSRLQHSAQCFGFKLDVAELSRQLEAQPTHGCWRVRLTLDKAGNLEVAAFPLVDLPETGHLARIALQTIDSGSILRRHKTTERQIYDTALASLSPDSAVFDVIFLNERGELAEGARSNIFVERDGVLLTPPLSSGCLPGVLRAELLAAGRAREAVLRPEDLAAGFWLGNSLRGLLRVELEQ